MTHRLLSILFCAALTTATTLLAQLPGKDFESIRAIPDRAERFAALEEFLGTNPPPEQSRMANQLLYNAALTLGHTVKALRYAISYIELAPDRPSAYNEVAWQFAEQSVHLDSALAFIDRALESYETTRGRKSGAMLDTKGWVLFKRENFAAALATQREAIALLPKEAAWNPQYAEYFYRLGLYLTKETSTREEGLVMLARCAIFGTEDAIPSIRAAIAEENRTSDEFRLDGLLARAAGEIVAQSPNPIEARANVAISLTKKNILHERQRELVGEIARLLTPNSSADDKLITAMATGIIAYNRGDDSTAIRELMAARRFASPYTTDLFLHLGQAYERSGNNQAALESYLSGALALRPGELMKRIENLHMKLYGKAATSRSVLDSLIKERAKQEEAFSVEEFHPEGKTKTVLAELFTGSECRPCAAADIAYDKLIERYNRSTLAVLEYHLHIPAPDPMTNADAETRAKYYEVTSTPTSIIDGTERTVGGGPPIAARSRFAVFSDAIERRLSGQFDGSITVEGVLREDVLTTNAVAQIGGKFNDTLALRFALAEELVEYRGVNNISPHRFVVRSMIGTPAGKRFDRAGRAQIAEAIVLQTLQDSLKAYLDAFEAKTPGKKVFKEKKHEIKTANLFLVAFIQNESTKEVLQAAVTKISE